MISKYRVGGILITVNVKTIDAQKNKLRIRVDEGINLEEFFRGLGYYRMYENYFIVINGMIQQPHYILEEGDEIEIFQAMCGG